MPPAQEANATLADASAEQTVKKKFILSRPNFTGRQTDLAYEMFQIHVVKILVLVKTKKRTSGLNKG